MVVVSKDYLHVRGEIKGIEALLTVRRRTVVYRSKGCSAPGQRRVIPRLLMAFLIGNQQDNAPGERQAAEERRERYGPVPLLPWPG